MAFFTHLQLPLPGSVPVWRGGAALSSCAEGKASPALLRGPIWRIPLAFDSRFFFFYTLPQSQDDWIASAGVTLSPEIKARAYPGHKDEQHKWAKGKEGIPIS